MPLRHRPHQGRLLLQPFLGIHVRSGSHQRLHGFYVPRARARHERGFARPLLGGVGIRPGLDEFLDHRGAAVAARQRERSNSIDVCRIHVGAGSDQKLRCFEIIPVGRPRERRRSIRLGAIYIHLLLQQRTHRFPVSLFDRLHQSQIATSRNKASHR